MASLSQARKVKIETWYLEWEIGLLIAFINYTFIHWEVAIWWWPHQGCYICTLVCTVYAVGPAILTETILWLPVCHLILTPFVLGYRDLKVFQFCLPCCLRWYPGINPPKTTTTIPIVGIICIQDTPMMKEDWSCGTASIHNIKFLGQLDLPSAAFCLPKKLWAAATHMQGLLVMGTSGWMGIQYHTRVISTNQGKLVILLISYLICSRVWSKHCWCRTLSSKMVSAAWTAPLNFRLNSGADSPSMWNWSHQSPLVGLSLIRALWVGHHCSVYSKVWVKSTKVAHIEVISAVLLSKNHICWISQIFSPVVDLLHDV